MTAYYNEIDPYAAEWLRNLIKAGHIADGEVDERSIVDVRPDDLVGFTQCHFFAGIGVWSYALRLAGWPDDEPVWTGSCPCQPFSAAGKGKGFDDERHLWPVFHRLIAECRPSVVLGEQVASADGLEWLDLVCADLEASHYAAGAVDLCAAGVGAPHIRQRLWWIGKRVADASRGGRGEQQAQQPADCGREGRHPDLRGRDGRLADADAGGRDARVGHDDARRDELHDEGRGEAGRLADADGPRSAAWLPEPVEREEGHAREPDDRGGELGWEPAASAGTRPRPTDGFWRDADWLYCRDGKWRPVEPGTFPLAHGATSRVGRLRAYGNAIVAPVAATFVRAVMEAAQ
jgi:DNA (cytosine-5)-methyltransferase 1